jgi:hypothetical protein
MVDQRRNAPTFLYAMSAAAPGCAVRAAPLPKGAAASPLLIRPRLIIPPSASMQHFVWAFRRTPKLVLPED